MKVCPLVSVLIAIMDIVIVRRPGKTTREIIVI